VTFAPFKDATSCGCYTSSLAVSESFVLELFVKYLLCVKFSNTSNTPDVYYLLLLQYVDETFCGYQTIVILVFFFKGEDIRNKNEA